MFPAVAFRPTLLLGICAALTAVAIAIAAWAGQIMVGVFFGIGLGLGLLNAVLVQRSVAAITIVGLSIAWFFRPAGLGVVFGLALFQIVLVVTTALPVWKKIRTGDPDSLPEGDNKPGTTYSNPASIADDMFKD